MLCQSSEASGGPLAMARMRSGNGLGGDASGILDDGESGGLGVEERQ